MKFGKWMSKRKYLFVDKLQRGQSPSILITSSFFEIAKNNYFWPKLCVLVFHLLAAIV